MATSTSYKPSPLSFGSPRASPFRRPESPSSPSPLRNSTSTNSIATTISPSKTMATPSKLNPSSTTATDADSWTPRGLPPAPREPAASPTRGANSPRPGPMLTSTSANVDANTLSKLQPAQVRELREGFQILDRDSDGVVGRDDVADMLAQLGLPASSSDTAAFFPPSTPQTVTLPTFLTQISKILASISPSSELVSAFAAFDDDDSGQVDLAELRDALLHTAPDPGESALTAREVDKIVSGFSGRKAFGKGMSTAKRGEVFKYQEFVGAVAGGASMKGNKEDED